MDTPHGQFDKLDQLLPVKKSQNPVGRGKDSAMNSCRNHSVFPSEDGSLPGFKEICSIPMSSR
jgi:hypothetical protein